MAQARLSIQAHHGTCLGSKVGGFSASTLVAPLHSLADYRLLTHKISSTVARSLGYSVTGLEKRLEKRRTWGRTKGRGHASTARKRKRQGVHTRTSSVLLNTVVKTLSRASGPPRPPRYPSHGRLSETCGCVDCVDCVVVREPTQLAEKKRKKKRKEKPKTKNIQQWVFAGGHPPNY
jgi:hypothetical protein